MGKYTVQVFTGDHLGAGTSNSIFIKFIGTNCNSKPHQLKTMTGFWTGSVSWSVHTVTCLAISSSNDLEHFRKGKNKNKGQINDESEF